MKQIFFAVGWARKGPVRDRMFVAMSMPLPVASHPGRSVIRIKVRTGIKAKIGDGCREIAPPGDIPYLTARAVWRMDFATNRKPLTGLREEKDAARLLIPQTFCRCEAIPNKGWEHGS